MAFGVEMTDRRIQRGNETKQKLIQATIEILEESGLRGVSSRSISNASGIQRSLIFHHFGTVDGLVFAALDHLKKGVLGLSSIKQKKNPEDFFIKTFQFLTEELLGGAKSKATFSLYEKALFDGKYRAAFVSQCENNLKFFKDNFMQVHGNKFEAEDLEQFISNYKIN